MFTIGCHIERQENIISIILFTCLEEKTHMSG